MKFFDKLTPYTHWLLRIALSGIFLYHGITKFPAVAGLAQMMNMPLFMIYLLAMMEIAAGGFILIGGLGIDWASRVAGLLIAIVMTGAILLVHWGQWNFAPSQTHPMGGMEFQFTVLMLGLYFLIRGNPHRALTS